MRELDKLRWNYMKEKSFTFIGMWESEWCRLYKTRNFDKKQIREIFSYRCSLAAQQLVEELGNKKFFSYVQCDIGKPEFLDASFANFSPIFKNTLVTQNYISEFTKIYAGEGAVFSQSLKTLISSFTLHNATLITLLFDFLLTWVLFVPKNITSFNTLQGIVSTALYGQQLTQEDAVTRIQTPV